MLNQTHILTVTIVYDEKGLTCIDAFQIDTDITLMFGILNGLPYLHQSHFFLFLDK